MFAIGSSRQADRVVVTESAIDAMSLASIEAWPEGTLYVSTGGGYGRSTDAALHRLLRDGAELVAATDRGAGGEMLTRRLRTLAAQCGIASSRLAPEAKDWNDRLARA